MTKNKIRSLLLAVLVGIFLVSCSNDSKPNKTDQNIEESSDNNTSKKERSKDADSKDSKLAVNIKNKSKKDSHPAKKELNNEGVQKVIDDNPQASEEYNKNPKDDESKEEEKADNNKENEQVDNNKDDSQEDSDAIYVTDDGEYYTGYHIDSDGEIGPYGNPESYYIKIEGDYLVVKGSMAFNSSNENILANNTYKFKLSEQTKLIGVTGDGEYERSIEDFNYVTSPSNVITVKDGKVSKVRGSA